MEPGIVEVVLMIWVVITAGLVTFVYLRSKADPDHRAILDQLDDAPALYSDRFCSGRSLRSFRTKYAGARNCLRVVVTSENLFVLAPVQFLVYFTEKLDLEHAIPKSAIREFQKIHRFLQTRYRVSYEGRGGEMRTIELSPRRLKEFEEAMSAGMSPLPSLKLNTHFK
jgi:hypothetical protein